MRFTDVHKRKIVSTGSAETVGRVSELLVDPGHRSVAGLVCSKTKHGSVIPWGSLTAVGDDAITISDDDKIVEPEGRLAELQGKAHRLLGKRVLSAGGDVLGEVDDVDFDPESGRVLTLLLDTGEVPGVRLVGVGSYAVVVATA